MCGIAGQVDFAGLVPEPTEARLNAALSRLKRRGPDGRGRWRDAHCALAHTRLAIIELSPLGAQPMHRDDLVITFNGEIFNYSELRNDLAALGHAFRSHSDTEVLLAGWRQWGEALLPKLIGMFAFAIWDKRSRTLYAARDRFGEKPFLYAETARGLAFGSDLLACEAVLGEQRALDLQALRALFTLRFVPDPLTISTGVRKLEAGTMLRFDQRGLSVTRWYDLGKAKPQELGGTEESFTELRHRFDAAVAARLVADVPVGVFLSGGIDSALVAASVARSGAKLKTFTVGFEGAGSYYEERPLARAVAHHLGADHTEISLNATRAGSVLDAVFEGLDEPFADSSAVPTFLVAEATRKKVSVVLTGDGADEMFAGYRRYWAELYVGRWQRIPPSLRNLLERVLSRLPEGKHHRLLEAIRRLRRFAETASGDPAHRQAAWMRLMPESEIGALLAPAAAPSYPLERIVAQLREQSGETDELNAALACDVRYQLSGDMLVKVDRMSMTHALETRAPFLDQRVAEWAFALPGSTKLALVNGRPVGKRMLRQAFSDRLPPDVFVRPKRGFELPVKQLLSGPASERLDAASRPSALAAQGLFAPDVIQSWRRDMNTHRRDTSWHLWTFLAFQEWTRLHRRSEALA